MASITPSQSDCSWHGGKGHCTPEADSEVAGVPRCQGLISALWSGGHAKSR